MSSEQIVPEVTDLECSFGTTKYLPAWGSLTQEEKRNDGPFCAAASTFFFKGGMFDSVGLVPKPGVDARRARKLVQAHLASWEPKHEHKIGGVAHLLAKWFDVKDKP